MSRIVTVFSESGKQLLVAKSVSEAASFMGVAPTTVNNYLKSDKALLVNKNTDTAYQVREGEYVGEVRDRTRRKTLREREEDLRKAKEVKASTRVDRNGKVYQWSLQGLLIGTYSSGLEAAKATGLKTRGVYSALNPGSVRGEYGGFLWSKDPKGPKSN